jgi:uracil-DNA glycosylase
VSGADLPPANTLGELFQDMVQCARCELAITRTQVVIGVGPARARVMFVGEAPGAQEDRDGRPFVGLAGRFLDQMLARNGVSRDDVFITNLVACRPPGNRTPRVREVRAHAPWLEEQLRLVAPELLVTLGGQSLAYFLPGTKVLTVHGVLQRIERYGREIPLLPLVHPAAAGRFPGLVPEFDRGIARVAAFLSEAHPG